MVRGQLGHRHDDTSTAQRSERGQDEETLGLLQAGQRQEMRYAAATDTDEEKGAHNTEQDAAQLHHCCIPLLLIVACILLLVAGWYLVTWIVAKLPGLIEWARAPENELALAGWALGTAGVVLLLVIFGVGFSIKAKLLTGEVGWQADIA
ncbi:hypothetical protein LTR85_000336 [Meristemomyces frigidus]|nr:hypothetical protein LTR85_000336 [Meristemomyces frigidus]